MLCFIFRFLITRAQDISRNPGLLLRVHLRTCQKCRHFYDVSNNVSRRLRQETPVVHCAHQSYLTRRIVAELPPCSAILKRGPSTMAKYLLPAAAAAIVLLVLGGWYFLASDNPPQMLPRHSFAGLSVHHMLSFETVLSDEIVGDNMLAEWPGWIEAPVAGEVKRLTSDVQNATNLLLACLGAGADGEQRP